MDGFETTFEVPVDPETAWSRLTATPGRSEGRYVLPGFEADVPVTVLDPPRRLVAVKDEAPCAGTTIEISLEAGGEGTRVTVCQSGFDETIPHDLLTVGWGHIKADVAVALGRGARLGRHGFPWPMLGVDVIPTAEGLVVRGTWDESGEGLDLHPGDLLVSVNGSPVSSRTELEAVLRAVRGGEQVEVVWLRGSDEHRASVALS